MLLCSIHSYTYLSWHSNCVSEAERASQLWTIISLGSRYMCRVCCMNCLVWLFPSFSWYIECISGLLLKNSPSILSSYMVIIIPVDLRFCSQRLRLWQAIPLWWSWLASGFPPGHVTMLGMAMFAGCWWLEHVFVFFHSVGNVIVPIDELLFFRGVGQPPTSIVHYYIDR